MEAATQKDEQQTDEKQGDGDGHVGTVEEIQGGVDEVAFPDHPRESYKAREGQPESYLAEERENEAATGQLILEAKQHLVAVALDLDPERVVDLGQVVGERDLDHDSL